MAKYRLKRKTYGIGDAIGNTLSGAGNAIKNTVGGVAETVGKAADTKLGGFAGALGGLSLLGGMGLGPIGWLASSALGAAAVRGAGKGLQSVGQNMQN